MPIKTKALLVITCFVSIFCFLTVFRSEWITSNVATAQTNSSRLSLELSKSQDNHLRGEPISFTLKLSNQTNQPISWKGKLSGTSHINLIATNADGVETRFEGKNYVQPSTYIPIRVMQPGEQVQESWLLETELLDRFFLNAGTYSFRVEFEYHTGVPGEPKTKITSNPISINVVQPQGINLQAYQYIREKFGASSHQLNTHAVTELRQEFVNRFRNTVYAKYIIVKLGDNYEVLGEDAKAVRELCKISGENFHHTDRVEKTVRAIGARLYPVNWNLPPDAPPPIVRHPCTGINLNQ